MLRDAEKVFQFEKLKCTVTCVCFIKKNKDWNRIDGKSLEKNLISNFHSI